MATFQFNMEWLREKYRTVKTAFKACFGLSCLSTSGATASDQAAQPVTETAVVQPETPSSLKSEDVSHSELATGKGRSSHVAPDDTVRPPVSKDYGLTGLGDTSPPEESVNAFISPPLTRGSLPAELDSVHSGGDRRDEASTREPRRKALLVGTLFTASLSGRFSFRRLFFSFFSDWNIVHE
jgi:hypothetical protein